MEGVQRKRMNESGEAKKVGTITRLKPKERGNSRPEDP